MAEYLEDLKNENSKSYEDGNYFILTFEDLELGRTYETQFRWKYKDGTFGKEWSASKIITSPFKSSPNTPQFLSSNVTGGEGGITVEWNGKDTSGNDLTNIDRVEVWISEPPFDGTKPVYQSKTKFKTQIQAPAGAYTVALYAVTVNGQYSLVSSAYTVSVTGVAQQIDPPTLPSGLSVASAPFSVSVNWNGQYSVSGFEGFKSIDIHVRGSNVGATATSGFSTTTQVATLTVDSTTNRQNIGLDNLRQALSLASNSAAYTAPMFFYYIARNLDDELYSVGGTPTYTRINSSSVNPTQANFVDLVNGIISIENLVAGNGRFTSWLRTGGSYTNGVFGGGTRIELSAVNDFTDPTNSLYTIEKGLTAYNSGNTKIFDLNLDAGTLTIQGDGTFTGNLSIGTGSNIFKAEPSKGIWLGSSTYTTPGDAPFSVAVNGALYSKSGTIAGWQIQPDYFQNTAGTFKISSTNANPNIQIGSDQGANILISATNGIVHNSTGSTESGNFTLGTNGAGKIAGWVIATNQISKGNTIISASESNGYIQIGSGTSFFKVGSSGLQLGNETFGSAPFSVSLGGSVVMKDATITGSGIYIGSSTGATDKILSTGVFSLGGGIITGTSTGVTFNLATGNSITFSSMSPSDDDNWAGDPTVTIRDSDQKLVKGRRLIFNSAITGSSAPVNPSSSVIDQGNNSWWDSVSKTGEYVVDGVQRPVKGGDLLLIQETA